MIVSTPTARRPSREKSSYAASTMRSRAADVLAVAVGVVSVTSSPLNARRSYRLSQAANTRNAREA